MRPHKANRPDHKDSPEFNWFFYVALLVIIAACYLTSLNPADLQEIVGNGTVGR